MKTVYGRSLVEGAPIGNKNAAGPHKGLNRLANVFITKKKECYYSRTS
jgi:hypothetical protein